MASQVVKALMLKLETGMPTNKFGFTLIELLVVIVILGITTSMAVMAFGDFGKTRRIQAEAERFTQKLKLVRYHAILEAVPYRIDVHTRGYQIFRFVPPNHWEKSHLTSTHIELLNPKQQTIYIQASGEISTFKLVFGISSKHPITEVNQNHLIDKLC